MVFNNRKHAKVDMNKFLEEIIDFLSKATGQDIDYISSSIEKTIDERYGDYAFPCFKLAKIFKANPVKIAENISNQFQHSNLITKCSPLNGYINFYVNKPLYFEYTLSEIIEKGLNYGNSDLGKGKTVIIDFSSPNIAKPFSIAHLRSTSIGNSIYLIYKCANYKCIRVNHLGDWGTQFGKLIVAFTLWGNEKELAKNPIQHLFELYVKFHKEEKNDPSLLDSARAAFKNLEDKRDNELNLWKRFRDYSLEEFNRIYKLLDVEFDSYAGESFYNEMIPEVINELKTKKLVKESEEALIVDLAEYNLPPLLLVKKDETYLYATRDICAAIYRKNKYDFEKNLYVVGHQQELHFKQLFKTLELMGYNWVNKCKHISFGMLNFQDEIMSTRAGNVIFLEDVLNRAINLVMKIIEEKNPTLQNKDEVAKIVGIGAVLFSDLSSRREKDITFKWEEILNFDGRTGPYVQYTYVRTQSVLRKYLQIKNQNSKCKVPNDTQEEIQEIVSNLKPSVNYGLLNEDIEFWLCKMLGNFCEKINTAREEYEPSIIANYLLDLCELFNNYYQKHRIISESEELTKARIIITYCVGIVLKKGLFLLGIKSPERM